MEIMREAGLEPLVPYPGTGVPWKSVHTACGREVTPRLGNIRKGQFGCLYCAGRFVDPEAAAEVMRAAGLRPLEPYPGSDRKWRCVHEPCGREVTPRYVRINGGGGPCRFCSRSAPVTAEQAVAEMRAAGMEPQTPWENIGLDSKWPAVCMRCGTLGAPRLGSIRRGQGGCMKCGRQQANASMRHDEQLAIAAMRTAGLEPLEPYPGTALPWKCRCSRCGSIVSPRLGSLTGATRPSCRRCANRATAEGQRHDAAEAEERMRGLGLVPQEAYRGVKYPWRCRCEGCGGVTSPTYGSILAGQSGCRRCADVRAGAARREDPRRAAEDMRAAGFEPLEPYQTCMTPWRSRHSVCGRISTPTLSKVRSGRGCRYCARHGFDRAASARVYVVVHPGHKAVKIGVAGLMQGYNDRIAHHRRFGWMPYFEQAVPTGDDALRVEQNILRRLRSDGHGPFLTAKELPNGWSETFDATAVSAQRLQQMIMSETEGLVPAELTLF
ncbi:hypothetical protein [Streptomyces sp. MN13]